MARSNEIIGIRMSIFNMILGKVEPTTSVEHTLSMCKKVEDYIMGTEIKLPKARRK